MCPCLLAPPLGVGGAPQVRKPCNQQYGAALWMIDKLGLHVGGEEEDLAPGAVGCCSLCVKDLIFATSGYSREMKLSFECENGRCYGVRMASGKGSIDIGYNKIVWPVGGLETLQELGEEKTPESEVFYGVDPGRLAITTQDIMPGLTPEVLRIYHASKALEQRLAAADMHVECEAAPMPSMP
ncbi:unnamed protein product [Chrysoparadoxa australica]